MHAKLSIVTKTRNYTLWLDHEWKRQQYRKPIL